FSCCFFSIRYSLSCEAARNIFGVRQYAARLLHIFLRVAKADAALFYAISHHLRIDYKTDETGSGSLVMANSANQQKGSLHSRRSCRRRLRCGTHQGQTDKKRNHPEFNGNSMTENLRANFFVLARDK